MGSIRASTRIDRMKSRLIVYSVGSVGHACLIRVFEWKKSRLCLSPRCRSCITTVGIVPALRGKLFHRHEQDRIHNWLIEHLNYSSRRQTAQSRMLLLPVRLIGIVKHSNTTISELQWFSSYKRSKGVSCEVYMFIKRAYTHPHLYKISIN